MGQPWAGVQNRHRTLIHDPWIKAVALTSPTLGEPKTHSTELTRAGALGIAMKDLLKRNVQSLVISLTPVTVGESLKHYHSRPTSPVKRIKTLPSFALT